MPTLRGMWIPSTISAGRPCDSRSSHKSFSATSHVLLGPPRALGNCRRHGQKSAPAGWWREGAWSFLLLRLSPRTWPPSIHRHLGRFAKRHTTRRLHASFVQRCTLRGLYRGSHRVKMLSRSSVKSRSFFARNVAAPASLFGLTKGCWPLHPRSTALEALSNILTFYTRQPHLSAWTWLGNIGIQRREIVSAFVAIHIALDYSRAHRQHGDESGASCISCVLRMYYYTR